MITWFNKFFKNEQKNQQFFLEEEHDVSIHEFKKIILFDMLENWLVAGLKFNQKHLIVWMDGVREVYFPEFTTLKNEKEILNRDGENGLFLVKVFSLNKNLNNQISSGKRINL